MSTLYDFIPEKIARYLEGEGIGIKLESLMAFNDAKLSTEVRYRIKFTNKFTGMSVVYNLIDEYLKANEQERCEALIEFLRGYIMTLTANLPQKERMEMYEKLQTSPILVSGEMSEDFKEIIKNNSEEGKNMDKILKFIEKNGIKYVRDNSVFPGKYNYLFYKPGHGIFVEFHNLTNDEMSNERYQDIIIARLKLKYNVEPLHTHF